MRKGRFGALALVTDNDVAFGMARMYEILAERLAVQIGVFRDLGDALAWLDGKVLQTHEQGPAAAPRSRVELGPLLERRVPGPSRHCSTVCELSHGRHRHTQMASVSAFLAPTLPPT